jgi:hypothetical protein
MPVARQQIPNMHQWANWEVVFSVWSAKQQLNSNRGTVFLCSLCCDVITRTIRESECKEVKSWLVS